MPGFWSNENIYAAVLFARFGKLFGTDTLEGDGWTPETMRQEIFSAEHEAISDENLGKLVAAYAVVKTDNLFRTASSFITTIKGLLGDGSDMILEEPLDVKDIAFGITQAFFIFPPTDTDEFAPDVKAYIQVCLDREGILQPPSALSFMGSGMPNEPDEELWEIQLESTQEIEDYVQERTEIMVAQLEQLTGINLELLGNQDAQLN